MQRIEKEVLAVISEIIDNLCLQNLKLNKMAIESKFPLTTNKPEVFLYDEISQGNVKLDFRLTCQQNVRTNEGSVDFENSYARSMSESDFKLEELHSVFSEATFHYNVIREKFNPLASIEGILRDGHRLKFFHGSWEKVLNKCGICYAKKFKDVFVQTIAPTSATADSQCQCNILPTESSNFILAEDPERKKIKLNSHCYSYVSYGNTQRHFRSPEASQTGSEPFDIESIYSDQNKSKRTLKSASQIRVGLSKRYKPRRTHN